MKSKTTVTAIVLAFSLVAVVFFAYQSGVDLDETQANALDFLLKSYALATLYCIIAGELTKNYSQVDRLWSTIPIFYVWSVAYFDGFEWRSLVLAVLVSLWGLRLSINFALKGGFSWLPWKGEEDYRWEVLRAEGALSKPLIWSVFNIFFICIYQMALILYFTLPSVLTINSDMPFSIVDVLIILGFLFFLAIETMADIQQFRFQKEKHRRINSGEDMEGYAHGFVRTGLWAYMRHPNYMAEQSIWLMVYLAGAAATGDWFNWTIGGFILLVFLFRGSSDFSEKISASKYPAYEDYQKNVGRFLPKLF